MSSDSAAQAIANARAAKRVVIEAINFVDATIDVGIDLNIERLRQQSAIVALVVPTVVVVVVAAQLHCDALQRNVIEHDDAAFDVLEQHSLRQTALRQRTDATAQLKFE